MRLFIAINLNDDTQSRLLTLQNELHTYSKSGNFTLPDNLHLTLVFLGECNAKQADLIKSAMDTVAFEPIDLQMNQLGRFKRDEGDIWWAGVRENKELVDLQQRLVAGLRASGFQCDNRKYTPHITLGRKIISDLKPRTVEPFGEMAYKIDLMKSERIGDRLVYTSIYRR